MPPINLVPANLQTRLDSEIGQGAGIWFERQLEQVSSKILRAKRPALNGLTLFPLSEEVSPGAESYTRRMYEALGKAEVISNYAADLPRADVSATEESVKMKDVGLAFGYSVSDIAAALFANMDLSAEKGIGVRVGIETTLNDIVWHGIPALNLFGVLNHPFVPRWAMPNAVTAALDTIVQDMAAAFKSVKSDTKDVEQPDRILLAAKVHSYLGTRFRTSTDTTGLDMLAKGCGIPVANIIAVHELEAAGDAGGDLMIADRRNPMVMAHVLPIPFEQRPVQERNLEFVVNCRARSGGMMASYPMGMRIAEFPTAL